MTLYPAAGKKERSGSYSHGMEIALFTSARFAF